MSFVNDEDIEEEIANALIRVNKAQLVRIAAKLVDREEASIYGLTIIADALSPSADRIEYLLSEKGEVETYNHYKDLIFTLSNMLEGRM